MLVEIKNLFKVYNRKDVLFAGLDLSIPENKLIAIYGVSGAGKSTLLNIIGLIEDYDEGEMYLFGNFAPEIYSHTALLLRRQSISYLFQNFALIEDRSIQKNLEIALAYSKLSKSQKLQKMEEILHKVHINHNLKTKVYSLSGGEKQRVAVARALLKESKLILADEPTGSVDKGNRDEIMRLLRQEVEAGKTVVIVTHDPEIVAQSDVSIAI